MKSYVVYPIVSFTTILNVRKPGFQSHSIAYIFKNEYPKRGAF